MQLQGYAPKLSQSGQIREHLRNSFRARKARPVAFRKEQLLQLAYLFQDNIERFQDSLRKDLGRPILESNLCVQTPFLSGVECSTHALAWCSFDVSGIIAEALYAYKNIDSWVKPDKAPFDFNWFAFSPKMNKEPKGTVLIISPFNYPLWCLAPIVSSICFSALNFWYSDGWIRNDRRVLLQRAALS
jgi:aldehyde dehydrogenase (NAD+)